MQTYEEIISKIITATEAEKLFTPAFRKQNRIVFTNGCFDLLHRGHVYLLSKARELGDLLVIGLNGDASVSKLKGPDRPVNDQRSRAEVIGALAAVDYVIIFHEDTPMNLLHLIRPDFLVKGGDYKLNEIVGYKEVMSWGGKVQIIPLVEGYSTSSILKKSN